jgi:hypothetical protein
VKILMKNFHAAQRNLLAAEVMGNLFACEAGEEISHVYSEGGIIEEPLISLFYAE